MEKMNPPSVRPGRVTPLPAAHNPRLARMRRLGWLLDRSIPIGGYRIGLDPLLGLLPGVGDTVMAAMSVVIIYDAARLGLPVHVLLRMMGNVAIDTVIGSVPIVGDLFDFAWQANTRNLQLVERHYDPIRGERPPQRITTAIAVVAGAAVLGLLVLASFLLRALWELISQASV